MKRRRASRILVLAAACAVVPAGLAAQAAVVAADRENFRAEPNGVVLAELLEGTPLAPGEASDRWRQVTVEAWIWAPSLEADSRAGHDLVVSAADGENLRASPNGPRIGRAREGMLLDRVDVEGSWVRVRRTGWIWEPSIRMDPDAPAPPSVEPESTPPSREFVPAGDDAVVRAAPGGDTVARLQPGAEVEVLARDGDWARVRVEGWAFAGSLGGDTAAVGILSDIPRDTLQAGPDRYRGRLVEWTIQFIALREAEQFRTDFLPGERFILARGPRDDPGFVYVAVPRELLSQVETLSPLQRLRVVGRVRSALSPLTGAPVLELIEITGR